MSEIQKFIKKVSDKENLSIEESSRAFQILLSGGVTPAQISAFLMGLKLKGETVEEITGAATAMRAKGIKFNAPAGTLDTCGTGGDGKGTYNISTAVALVAAGAGIPVAKHGNKAVSSNSGSADVLRELGVKIDAGKEVAERALKEVGIAFLFAPKFHTSLRDIGPVRQELGVRTIFNVLGPLTNPAGAKRQLMGVYSKDLVVTLAEVLKNLGSEAALVVHGEDGLDEITITGKTYAAELKDGKVREMVIEPEKFGVERVPPDQLTGGDARFNAGELTNVLSGRKGAYRDIVIINAAAAIHVAGKAATIADAIPVAEKSIDEGKAKEKLARLVEVTNEEVEAA